MKGILTRNEDGIWMVKWSDLHSFAHGTHWMFTELSSGSNSIKYIKDNLIMVKPLEEGLEVEFELVITGYDKVNFNSQNSAKLIFPEVIIFETEGYIKEYVKEYADLNFTHGFCPDCAKELYPEYADKIYGKPPDPET